MHILINIAIQSLLKCYKIYLHLQPSNIFISTSGQLQIQLGDFGLACPLQIGNQEEIGNHSVVGTHIYAAPEQLKGKCDPKVIKKRKILLNIYI